MAPLKVLVIGASQGTGALAVKAALARGHTVTAFSRHPDKLGLDAPSLKKFPGDFHKPEDVDRAMSGQDAVIITASVSSLKTFKENPNFFSAGTKNVIDAMKAKGARRLVVLSAIAVAESAQLLPFILRKIAGWMLRLPMEDHSRQEKLAEQSGLEFVIARPPRLTNGAARGKYVVKDTLEKVPNSMSRADLANFLVEACESPKWVNKAVQLGG